MINHKKLIIFLNLLSISTFMSAQDILNSKDYFTFNIYDKEKIEEFCHINWGDSLIVANICDSLLNDLDIYKNDFEQEEYKNIDSSFEKYIFKKIVLKNEQTLSSEQTLKIINGIDKIKSIILSGKENSNIERVKWYYFHYKCGSILNKYWMFFPLNEIEFPINIFSNLKSDITNKIFELHMTSILCENTKSFSTLLEKVFKKDGEDDFSYILSKEDINCLINSMVNSQSNMCEDWQYFKHLIKLGLNENNLIVINCYPDH